MLDVRANHARIELPGNPKVSDCTLRASVALVLLYLSMQSFLILLPSWKVSKDLCTHKSLGFVETLKISVFSFLDKSKDE